MDAADYEVELERCRTELATRLGTDETPDAVWGYVIKLGLPFHAILEGSDPAWQELVKEARVRLKDLREELGTVAAPPERARRDVPEKVLVELSEYSRQRGQVLSEVAAALAKLNPRVRSFRERFLGGPEQTVSVAEASEMLHDTDLRGRTNSISGLVGRQYAWQHGDTLWFLLTGHAPPIEPLSANVYLPLKSGHDRLSLLDYPLNTARIVLTAHVWVPAKEFERLFRNVQRQMVGGDNKATRKHVLSMAQFVAREIIEHGQESWQKRWERWSRRATPEEPRYKSY